MNVIPFPTRYEPKLTKRQLAKELGRSTRWIEQQKFPSELDEQGRQRYLLSEVLKALDGKGQRATS